MIHELIKTLQDKHNSFIGNLKDYETVANSKGFKQGLSWAIETAETIIKQKEAEEKYNKEIEENYLMNNLYIND